MFDKNLNYFITGGAGTLGTALVKKLTEIGAGVTIYSRDPLKLKKVKSKYPNVVTVVGDINDQATLGHAIAGHNVVIHAAAMKHIVEAELYPVSAGIVNVDGTLSVLETATYYGVDTVIGISTDKACAPVNAYGATKMLMERYFQAFVKSEPDKRYTVVRYGNVVGSNGSFIHNWRKYQAEGKPVVSTLPQMTRFWLTVEDAVDLVMLAEGLPSGTIYAPKLKSASIGDIEEWVLGKSADDYMGIRPGEKIHETLMTNEESFYAEELKGGFLIYPNTTPIISADGSPSYHSGNPDIFMEKEEFMAMLGEL